MDYETAQVHHLIVTASDSGINKHSSTITVTIQVEDTEDVIPIFVENQYKAQVPENQANYLVATVQVS